MGEAALTHEEMSPRSTISLSEIGLGTGLQYTTTSTQVTFTITTQTMVSALIIDSTGEVRITNLNNALPNPGVSIFNLFQISYK